MRMTFKVIIVGGLVGFFAVVTWVVFLPTALWHPERTIIAQGYTGDVGRGRTLFYSNGCNYCHTQYVRQQDVAMGPQAQGGNYTEDDPMTLGSERTGPDLSYIGRKRSEEWELKHLQHPRDLSPLSIMPNFAALPAQDQHDIVAYLFNLGDRNAAAWMVRPYNTPYLNAEGPPPEPQAEPGVTDQPKGWDTFKSSGFYEGKQIYIKRCQTCHGCAGNGLGTYGGTMAVTPVNFKQEPFRSMPDDEWFWHVKEGVPGTLMPVWKTSLEDRQIWPVIGYVQQLFAQPFYHDPDEGDAPPPYAGMKNPLENSYAVLDNGKAIYTRECQVCHGSSGRGEGPYRTGLEPLPPDLGDGSYGHFTDADYIWRLEVGVPWSAMPVWNLQYSTDELWTVVHYLRTMFTQTELRLPKPAEGQRFNYPALYKEQQMPATASFERGKAIYANMCSQCHGLTGNGRGPNGLYLRPRPTNLQNQATNPDAPPALNSMLTFGIRNSAMPAWGEWLPIDQRWDLVEFIVEGFQKGRPVTTSVLGNGRVPDEYATFDNGIFKDEGGTLSPANGKAMYGAFCSGCHGAQGQGDGLALAKSASGAPAAFPAEMAEAYVYWRISQGVPESTMPAFAPLEFQSQVTTTPVSSGSRSLTEADLRDITLYVGKLASRQAKR
jgi:cytochrome c oxidase cbb3-type subunit 2